MGKFEKKKTKYAGFPVVALALFVLILAALILWGPRLAQAPQTQQTQPAQTGAESPEITPGQSLPESQGSAATQPEAVPAGSIPAGAELPMLLEEGKLEITSLFQFDGINPDCSNEEGRNIAAITLDNTTQVLLLEAKVTVQLADGSEIDFAVTNLPAGATAILLSRENLPLEKGAVCLSASCEALWSDTTQTVPEGLEVTVDGMVVTVTNRSDREFPALNVYCRSSLGEEYFGGITYEYTIYNLSPNGSATILAADCVTGLAEVVRIANIHE